MALTRIKVEEINGTMEIVDKKTEIIDDNPVVYHGNEDLPITDDDISSGRVKYFGRGFVLGFHNQKSSIKNQKLKNGKISR
jgi:hypothetical protein